MKKYIFETEEEFIDFNKNLYTDSIVWNCTDELSMIYKKNIIKHAKKLGYIRKTKVDEFIGYINSIPDNVILSPSDKIFIKDLFNAAIEEAKCCRGES